MLKHSCFSGDAGPHLTSGILVQEVQGVFLTASIAVLPQASPDFYDVRSPCVALYSEIIIALCASKELLKTTSD